MKQNVGQSDRIIRIAGSLIILLECWYFKTWWGLIGLYFLITGVIGWCPVYAVLKISSCPKK